MKTIFILLMSFLYTGILLSQETVYVPFFTCEDCDKQIGVSTTYLLHDYINGYGKFKSEMAKKRDSSVQIENPTLARESAELLSTKFFLSGMIVKIVNNYHITVTMYATESGLTIWSTSALTNNLNDLPTIMDDVASKLAIDKEWSQHGDVYRVYSAESKKVKRKEANAGFGVSTGAFVDLSENEVDYLVPGLGILFSFDTKRFIFEANFEYYSLTTNFEETAKIVGVNSTNTVYFDIYTTNEYTYQNFYLNVIYPIRSSNSAPFACLGAGVSYMNDREIVYYDDNTYVGGALDKKTLSSDYTRSTESFYLNGGIGYVLKRNSTAKLFIYGRGYMYMRSVNIISYGAMLNFALVLGK